MTWKNFIKELVVKHCNQIGSRTFSRDKFLETHINEINKFNLKAKTPTQTISRVLQELRNENMLSFIDNKGTYTLQYHIPLENEFNDENIYKLEENAENINRIEYIKETYSRDRKPIIEAKEKFGLFCLHPECENSFCKNDGKPYIEVHHIIPLYQGGEDSLCNLAVVCAHHHKMAHFADNETQKNLQKLFLTIVESKLI